MRDKQNKKVEGRELFGQKALENCRIGPKGTSVVDGDVSKSIRLQSPFLATEDPLQGELSRSVFTARSFTQKDQDLELTSRCTRPKS